MIIRLLRTKRSRILVAISIVAGVAWLSGIRLFAYPGISMSPTVMAGDHFLGMVGMWGMRSPHRFDMVIFDVPVTSKWSEQQIPWMKRLVGLPGDHIRLTDDQLFIDGRKVDAPFLHVDDKVQRREAFDILLGESEYFVLGDNLDHSFEDSRAMGPLDRSHIKGFVAFVIR